jgi:heme-degrading monooxygenase HmoA
MEAAMYGTVARMKVKPGALESLKRMEERHPKGFIATYAYRMDSNPDELWLAVLFEDEASYRANANSPEQDHEYRDLRSHLREDPEWHDGEVVFEEVRKKMPD